MKGIAHENYPIQMSVTVDDGEIVIDAGEGVTLILHPTSAKALTSKLLDALLEVDSSNDDKCGARQYEPHNSRHRPPDPPPAVCTLKEGHEGQCQGRTMHGKSIKWTGR